MASNLEAGAAGGAKGALAGAGSGAVAGAAIGSVGGPIGAAAGAVIGAIVGAVGGVFSGLSSNKAKKKRKKAAAIQRQREEAAHEQSILYDIRKARIARASSLAASVAAGATQSSGSSGALSSIGSQVANTIEYKSVDAGRAAEISSLIGEAKSLEQRAEDIWGITETFLETGEAFAEAYKITGTSKRTEED